MKYTFLLIFLISSSFASTQDTTTQLNMDTNTSIDANITTTDVNTTTVIDYYPNVKHYFSSSQKLGINAQKGILRPYYKKEKYQLIWIKDEKLNPIYKDLLEYSKNDKVIGKKAKKNFNINEIETLVENYNENNTTVTQALKLDFLLTNLYDNYMNCIANGSIDWKAFKKYLKKLYKEKDIVANWEKYGAKINKQKLLKQILEDNDFSIGLKNINYNYDNAEKLNKFLSVYEEKLKDGGYIHVPMLKRSLKVGMKSKVVPYLEQRLIQSNDLIVSEDVNVSDTNTTKQVNNIYTKDIANAVKSFQKNNGLAVDGICGRDTIRHLNISIDKKIKQIKVNLERMRWMRRDLGKEYILVNIPDYNLRYYKNKKEVLKLSVVVGTRKHPTPIFSHNLSTVVLNPYWRVPTRIVQREIIPKLVKNPAYLNNKDMVIHENWSNESETYNPEDINWTMYAQNDEQKEQKIYPDIPYRFIQIPGKKNPLGKMKFIFRNRYMVYIHDTSAKHYFNRRKRAFSHGCIRLHNPSKLLKTIAKVDTKLDYKKAKEILEDIEQTEISLKKKIPIHIVYLTAWIDDNDNIQFRDDIYGYDKVQSSILY